MVEKIRVEIIYDVNKIKNGKIILKLKLGKDLSRCWKGKVNWFCYF